MSFQIKLQISNSEKNRVIKNVSDVLTVTGVLKNTTSIINPTIVFEGDISNVTRCNYMTIPTFNRSYFINDIKSIRNSLYEISATVDVLSSFSTEILACSGIVRRQENRWNLYLNDGTFRVYQNPMVLTREFPNGFSAPEFVLAVAGA